MPVSLTIDHDTRLIRIGIVGDFATAEMVDVVLRAAAGARGPGYDIISDHREIGTPATRAQMDGLVALLATRREQFAGARWAVIVSKPASYGMMRMLAVLLETIPIELAIFQDDVSAERWLRAGPGA